MVSNTAQTEQETVSEEEAALAALPEGDFNGRQFVFLIRLDLTPEWDIWQLRDIYSEEMDGTAINDAVYLRNVYVGEKYNCGITEIPSATLDADIKKAVSSDSDEYDIVLPYIFQSLPQASGGLYMDLNEIPNIDLSQNWWDGSANRDLSISGKLYATSSDMLIINNDAIGAVVFNKQMALDYRLPDIYNIVKGGDWTFDTFTDMLKGVSADLNGDGKMTKDDKYGFMLYTDGLFCMMHGSDVDVTLKDSDDIPYFALNSEKAITVFDMLFSVLRDKNTTYLLNDSYSEGITDAFKLGTEIFQSSRALLYWIRLRDAEAFRAMETDFGILPMPKYDSEQKEYRSTVNNYTGCLISVPVTNKNFEETGMLLEALAVKSKYTLQPAYYDITLNGKIVRDEESSEMLDLIFKNRVYDLGLIYNYGDIMSQLYRMLINDNRNFSSMLANAERIAIKDIDRVVSSVIKQGE